jgi:hypothetical protein
MSLSSFRRDIGVIFYNAIKVMAEVYRKARRRRRRRRRL